VLYMRVPPGLSSSTACGNNKTSFRKDNPGTQWLMHSTHDKQIKEVMNSSTSSLEMEICKIQRLLVRLGPGIV
jgi:hypothetical protein